MSATRTDDPSHSDGDQSSLRHRSSGASTPPTEHSDTDFPKRTADADARPSSHDYGDALEPIAIIGFSQNFPGESDTPERFWDLIVKARSALTEVPPERWNLDGFYSDNPAKFSVQKSKRAHFVTKDLSAFDAPFFSIPAAEAMYMDPQQRWLLETTYHAFENAGLSLDDMSDSRTSVFIGSFLQDYARVLQKDQQRRATYGTTGNGAAMLANRLSWFYNLKGPSLALDTACSGSLIALHLACQSIRNGETDMGVIGACNLMLSPETFIALSDNGFLSKDGKSYSFDHRANGYSRGEGSGIVIIKRLSDAIRDGNVVRAVVRGSGSNQDGRTLGITLPNADAQKALIRETYRTAGLSMSETGYFEAHGTGTPMGDPIEARAIAESFEGQISPDRPLCVGSLKPLIGHLENASGVASLIKAILVLEKGIVPPCGHMEKVNETIEQNGWPIMFPTSAMMWPTRGLRRVSINSFGYGGANCHVVLDDAMNYGRQRAVKIAHRTEGIGRPLKLTEVANRPRLLCFSAADKDGVSRLAESFEQYILDRKGETGSRFLADLAFTLSQKRSRFSWKSSLMIPSCDSFTPDMLKKIVTPSHASKQLNALFVFTGQGAQWAQMGQGLLSYRVFAASIEASEKYLRGLGCKWCLAAELQASEESSRVNEPEVSQVLCTSLQIALVDLLRDLLVEPKAVIGHSSGEIAAAYCAGFISHSSAMKLAYSRGIVSALACKLATEPLGMMAVAMSRQDAQDLIDGEVDSGSAASICVACINSPKNVTLSGPLDSLETIRKTLDEREIFARVLKTGMAYHSPYMECVAPVYQAMIQGVESDPRSDRSAVMFSSTTARRMTPAEALSPGFWVQNLVSSVRFSEAVSQVFQDSKKTNVRKLGARKQERLAINFALEIGPHPALKSAVHDVLETGTTDAKIVYSPTLQRNKEDVESLLVAVGLLHDHGSDVDIMTVNQLHQTRDDLTFLTDLPAYPFNHSKKFWSEGRVSKAFNHRRHRPHELLGVRDPSSSTHEPKWKHRISPDEQTWVKDHHVFGSDVYPAAGLLVMALEAARQLSDSEKPISAFLFQSVTISQALIIKPGQLGIETETSLKLLEDTRGRAPTWYSFRICAFADQNSYECCSGEIGIEYEHPASEIEGATTQQMLFASRLQILQSSEGTLPTEVSVGDFYEMIGDAGLQFGPSFRGIESLHCSEDPQLLATATVNTLHWRDHVDDPDISSHIIHPAALDSILQPANAAISHGKKELVPSMVPTRIPTFRIAAKACLELENPRVKVHGSATNIGFRTASGRLFALEEKEQILLVDGIVEFTTVDNPNMTIRDPFGRCYHIDWQPDFNLMTAEEIQEHCLPVQRGPREQYRSDVPLIQDVRMQAIYHAAPLLRQTLRFKKKFEYMSHYVAFLQRKFDEIGEGFQPCENLDEHLDSVAEEVCQRPEGEITMRVARNLKAFLDGSADPLAVLFEDDLMARHYAEATADKYFQRSMTNYLDLIAHKNPQIKVLEIGAGTGSVSNVTIEALGRNGDGHGDGSRFSTYCYTDLSPSFFEAAKEKFAIYSDRMEFKRLDIGMDPTAQGFEDGSYDVVIAANVLHATPDLSATMDNVYRLLKPDGKLIMTDIMTPDSLRSSFLYGLFPGWWLSIEEERKHCPLLSLSQWNDKLQKHGFSAVELSYESDPDGDFHLASVLISTKPSEKPAPVSNHSQICIIKSSQDSELQNKVASKIKASAQEIGVEDCTILDLHGDNLPDLSQQFCVFLPELDSSYLNNLSAPSFQTLKDVLSQASGVLWVSGSDGTSNDAFSGMAAGLSRVYRTEHSGFKFVTLTVDKRTGAESVSAKAFRILSNTVSNADEFCEDEIRESNGLLHVGRLVQAKSVNQQIFSHSHRPAEMKSFRDGSDRKIALTIETPGLIETLQFDDAPFAARNVPLADFDIEVDILAAGVNFRDILIATGQYDLNCFGWEGVGIVREAGSAVSNVKVGDRVACMLAGAFANAGRCHGASVVKLPDDMTDEVGASIPIVACTAIYALQHVAQLSEGETVLIHSGAGGLGQMAIQMAQYLGAEIFTTVGSVEKRDFLHERYDIPLDHILYSRGLSFATALKGLTKGRGVDVILNSLGGQSLRETWKCVAPLGRFLEVGKKDALTFSKLPMEPFSESVTFACIDLAVVYSQRPALAGKLLRQAIELIQAKHLSTPDPLHVYSGSEIEKAFRLLQEGKSIGKAVIKFKDDDQVPVVPSKMPSWTFDANASYMIVGGLGGLGQNMARWMVDRGARNLILMSRRDEHVGKDAEFLDGLREMEVSILTPCCDVSDEESLKSALELCRTSMPPIKGCIQAAMVIRDERFQELKYADLQASIAPKVRGSLNLHKHLPQDLDFLVLLSSVSSIPGFEGQGNYAMGNVFQDQLARHRVSCGLKAVCIDLGIIYDAGFIANNATPKANMQKVGLFGLHVANLLSALERYCDPRLPVLSAPECQPIMGYENMAQVALRGGEVDTSFRRPLFACMNQLSHAGALQGGDGKGNGGRGFDVQAALARAKTLDEAQDVLVKGLVGKLSLMLGIDKEDIATDRPLHSYGIDSLVAIEIKNWFRKSLASDLSVIEILSNDPITELIALAVARSSLLATLRAKQKP